MQIFSYEETEEFVVMLYKDIVFSYLKNDISQFGYQIFFDPFTAQFLTILLFPINNKIFNKIFFRLHNRFALHYIRYILYIPIAY